MNGYKKRYKFYGIYAKNIDILHHQRNEIESILKFHIMLVKVTILF